MVCVRETMRCKLLKLKEASQSSGSNNRHTQQVALALIWPWSGTDMALIGQKVKGHSVSMFLELYNMLTVYLSRVRVRVHNMLTVYLSRPQKSALSQSLYT